MPHPVSGAVVAERGHPGSAPQVSPAGRLTVRSVDGMRGMAAVLVLLFHVLYWSGRPELGGGIARTLMVSGYVGVDFFFVISGFLLFLPTAGGDGNFGKIGPYARRRAARIIPAFYVTLGVCLLMAPLLTKTPGELPSSSLNGFANLLLHLTFLQHSVGLWLGFPEGFGINGAVWTLALEATFYVFLPLVASRFFRHPWLWFSGFAGVSVLWKLMAMDPGIGGNPAPGQLSIMNLNLVAQFPTYLAHFGLGMLVAILFVRWSKNPVFAEKRWMAVPVQVLALGLIGWQMYVAGQHDLAGTSNLYHHWTGTAGIAAAFALLLLSTALSPDRAQLLFTNPVSRRLGEVSYGIYLWHLPLIGFAMTTLHFNGDATDTAFYGLLGFVLPMSVLLGGLSWRLVEKPAINWARGKSRRTISPVPAAPSRRPLRPAAPPTVLESPLLVPLAPDRD